jgi:2,4-dienoyl-CoA reductase-like NADH-dependent reductase (Old Yellow Enzyme family)/thioredoxin reductase
MVGFDESQIDTFAWQRELFVHHNNEVCRMAEFNNLFSPWKIRNLELRNRIVMSPMTTDMATYDGEVTDQLINYYAKRAEGGVGLIITEDTSIGPRYSYKTLRLDDDKWIPGWRKLVASIHEHGAKIMPQLMHPTWNARAIINEGDQPVAASPIPSRLARELPRELSIPEIQRLVERMVEDTLRAQKVGCDGVFLHCAHDHHLLGTFLSPITNKRTDEYGGDILARAKLALDTVSAIRQAVGPDFPILMRISGAELEEGGRTIEDTQFIAPLLVEAGVDAFQLSVGTLGSLPFKTTPPMGTPFGPNRNYAGALKQVVDVPVICGTRITNPLVAEDILAKNQADAVGIGRALIADPEFANKANAGRREDIVPCWGCLHCLASANTDQGIGCSSNPSVGFEAEHVLIQTSEPKTVLVAGGGAGGLEAARVAKQRGHNVILMEKTDVLGGQLIPASFAPLKQETVLLIQHLVRQAYKVGVDLRLNSEVNAQVIETLKPDVIIDATGGVPIMPQSLPGINNDNVVKAWDILTGKAMVQGTNIVVIGGGQVGCEVADFIAHPVHDMSPRGNNVTLLEMVDNIALQEKSSARSTLVQRLIKKDVKIITEAKVISFQEDAVIYEQAGQQHRISGLDTIVVGMGTRPNKTLSESLQGSDIPVHVVGDANAPRQAVQAISEGAEVARAI